MRAAVLVDREVVEIQEVDDPAPAPDEVVIRVTASGICGSDLHVWRGHHPFRRPPVVLGHEVTGVVDQLGGDVATVAVGDRVAIEPHRVCGRCEPCHEGRHELCVDKSYPGTGGWHGTLAERFVAPATMAHPVPAGVPDDLAALAEPLAVACHAADRGGVAEGRRVSIIGAGSIGLLCLVVARSRGAEVDVVTDLDLGKLAVAERLGARRPHDARDGALLTHLRRHRQDRADVTFVAATAPASTVDAATLTRPGGTIVQLGLHADTALVDAARLVTDEQTIVGSLTYGRGDFAAALGLLAERPDVLAGLVTRRIPLADAGAEFRHQADGSRPSVKTLIVP